MTDAEGECGDPTGTGTRRPRGSAGVATGSLADGISIFCDDDAGYERWLQEHTAGYVVNAARNPNPGYLKVHRASCRFISSPSFRRRGWTTGDYLKICADDRDALARWAQLQVGGTLDAGCRCN